MQSSSTTLTKLLNSSNFQQQPEILVKRFIDEGYKTSDMKGKIEKANTFYRADLIQHPKNC